MHIHIPRMYIGFLALANHGIAKPIPNEGTYASNLIDSSLILDLHKAVASCPVANGSPNVTVISPSLGRDPTFEQRVAGGVARVTSARYPRAELYSVSAHSCEGVIRPVDGNDFKALQLSFSYRNKIVQIASDDESIIHSWRQPVEINVPGPVNLAPFAISDLQVTIIQAINMIMAAGYTKSWTWVQIQFPSPRFQEGVLQRFITLVQTSGEPYAVVMSDVTKHIFPIYNGGDPKYAIACPSQEIDITLVK